jgi:hypothetical protein
LHSRDGTLPGLQVQFYSDSGQMVANRVSRYTQPVPNASVCQSFGNQLDDLLFPYG